MNKILTGNSLDVLKTLEGNSIDSVITDPPYGYSFMGKDWDKAVPSVEIWKECLRVLKPGAFCLVMSAPRSDVQMHMIRNLEQAGFRIDFTPIYWTYASGFPKAGNIGKLVDKRNGRNTELYKEIGLHIKECRQATGYTLKQMNDMFGYVAGCTWWESQNDNNVRLPNLIDWKRLIELLNVDEKYTETIEREEALGDKVGEKVRSTAGFSNEAVPRPWKEKVGETMDVRKPATSQAKALDGSYAGFQPKPAVEVIIVAMKPLSEKTYVDQALKNGKGITWLDDARIPSNLPEGRTRHGGGIAGNGTSYELPDSHGEMPSGRFPANLLVSDDVLNDGVYRQPAGNKKPSPADKGMFGVGREDFRNTFADETSNSYSRYFDLDKWAENQKAPRVEEQTGHISRYSEDIIPQTLPFLIVPKASKSVKNKGVEDREAVNNKNNMQTRAEREGRGHRSEVVSKNNHPTVKPLKLMSYLITLFSRPGDTVLDPFCGSGTTCIAAKMLKREYIGIEREAEYVEIAEARLKAHEPDNQLELLDVG
jgi:site-specific DNA-methyltransferase (adenine-specific)